MNPLRPYFVASQLAVYVFQNHNITVELNTRRLLDDEAMLGAVTCVGCYTTVKQFAISQICFVCGHSSSVVSLFTEK